MIRRGLATRTPRRGPRPRAAPRQSGPPSSAEVRANGRPPAPSYSSSGDPLRRGDRRIRVGAIPPAAPERLEQCRGVEEALRARLDQGERRVLISLLRRKDLQVVRAAGLILG